MCGNRYSKTPEMVEKMIQIKMLFDPHFILNPYKVLPNDEVSKYRSAWDSLGEEQYQIREEHHMYRQEAVDQGSSRFPSCLMKEA